MCVFCVCVFFLCVFLGVFCVCVRVCFVCLSVFVFSSRVGVLNGSMSVDNFPRTVGHSEAFLSSDKHVLDDWLFTVLT